MSTDTVPIKFVVGSRTLWVVRRRLMTISCGLDDLLGDHCPSFGDPDPAAEGYRVLSVTDTVRRTALQQFPGHILGGVHCYRRHYIDMRMGFPDYMGRFSSKTRSTFKRKRRKLEQLGSGSLALERFRKPDEMERFFAEAVPLSRRTYQARLLDSGLPESQAARDGAAELAERDMLRAFILRLADRPIAYLYLPVVGATLVYAHLGYDPEFASYSAGTVLQIGALEQLFSENRFAYFDFTEGEGAHKELFGTNSVEACNFMLLRVSVRNRILLNSLDLFDAGTARVRNIAAKTGALAFARRMLRR